MEMARIMKYMKDRPTYEVNLELLAAAGMKSRKTQWRSLLLLQRKKTNSANNWKIKLQRRVKDIQEGRGNKVGGERDWLSSSLTPMGGKPPKTQSKTMCRIDEQDSISTLSPGVGCTTLAMQFLWSNHNSHTSISILLHLNPPPLFQLTFISTHIHLNSHSSMKA